MTKESPILNQINIVARDFDASLGFYRRLGVDIPRSTPGDEVRHAAVTLPNGVLLEFDNHRLAQIYSAAWRDRGGPPAVIGFSFASREEVDRVYEDLTAAGYVGRQRPFDAFWGARYAIVADPDGNDVGLMSPVDPSRRSWPPSDSPST
jgi:uncharacterized glyoxalase superfamily protein PhnB